MSAAVTDVQIALIAAETTGPLTAWIVVVIGARARLRTGAIAELTASNAAVIAGLTESAMAALMTPG